MPLSGRSRLEGSGAEMFSFAFLPETGKRAAIQNRPADRYRTTY
jgi:hypothetical protein